MPPPSSKPPPLPLAPNRASIANEISLLLSRRTALLKTLNPTSTTSSTSTTTTSSSNRYAANADAIEQLFCGPRPNQGVGYVPERADSATSAQDAILRRKLLGKNFKNGRGGMMKGAKGAESESDEDEGRSALGKSKRKRPRREEEEEEEKEVVVGGEGGKDGADADAVGGGRVEEEERGDEGKDNQVGDGDREHDNGDEAVVANEAAAVSGDAAEEAKRNKKKKKRQREKEKQRQKRLQQ